MYVYNERDSAKDLATELHCDCVWTTLLDDDAYEDDNNLDSLMTLIPLLVWDNDEGGSR